MSTSHVADGDSFSSSFDILKAETGVPPCRRRPFRCPAAPRSADRRLVDTGQPGSPFLRGRVANTPPELPHPEVLGIRTTRWQGELCAHGWSPCLVDYCVHSFFVRGPRTHSLSTALATACPFTACACMTPFCGKRNLGDESLLSYPSDTSLRQGSHRDGRIRPIVKHAPIRSSDALLALYGRRRGVLVKSAGSRHRVCPLFVNLVLFAVSEAQIKNLIH